MCQLMFGLMQSCPEFLCAKCPRVWQWLLSVIVLRLCVVTYPRRPVWGEGLKGLQRYTCPPWSWPRMPTERKGLANPACLTVEADVPLDALGSATDRCVPAECQCGGPSGPCHSHGGCNNSHWHLIYLFCNQTFYILCTQSRCWPCSMSKWMQFS